MDAGTAAAIAESAFAEVTADPGTPAVSWGIVHGGELVAAGGAGATPSGQIPTPRHVFRIASMTKSFTAATVLLLRDRGLLRLDDRLDSWLPWAAGVANEGPPILLRDLLTMTSGLATDDPWGDRQESLSHGEWERLVGEGLGFAWPTRLRWEYSNAGYALLGSVVAAVTAQPYVDAVTELLLDPLGMHATRYDHADVPADRLVAGHRLGREGVAVEPTVRPGVFSAMGGLHSCVEDLTTWVAGFAAAWHGDDRPHPLARWSRLEMQSMHRHDRVELLHLPDRKCAAAVGYGYGLWNTDVEGVGQVVAHSGGYPGYGSHMRWHAESGWGVVALGNSSYAPMGRVATEVLWRLLDDGTPRRLPVQPWPETLAAMDVAERLLRGWDDAVADTWFSANMDLDLPRAERAALLCDARDLVGAFTRDEASVDFRTPAHVTWEVHGDAALQVEVLMTPTRRPLIQRLGVRPLTVR